MAPMTASFAPKLRPSTVSTPVARPLATLMRATSALAMTSPPWFRIQAMRASVNLPAPPRATPKPAFEKAEEHVYTDGSGLFIGRHQVLAGHAREMRAHLFVLELFAEQIVTAHLHDAPQLATFAALVEHRMGGAYRSRRRIQRGSDHWQPGGGLQRHSPKTLGVAL